MLDLLQYYFWVLCNGMKTRFRMVMIAHPGPGIGFHKRFMWQIIIPPTPAMSKHGSAGHEWPIFFISGNKLWIDKIFVMKLGFLEANYVL